MPAVVHGRQFDPLVAQELEQIRKHAASGVLRDDGALRMAAFDEVDHVGRVLHGLVFRCDQHRDHGEAYARQDFCFKHAPRRLVLHIGNAFELEAGANFGGVIGSLYAVQHITGRAHALQ